MATRLVEEADNIRSFASERADDRGTLTVATSHLHARFTLASTVVDFCRSHPSVNMHLRQVAPNAIIALIAAGEADIGISTERIDDHPSLALLLLGVLRRRLIAPREHPLLRARTLTLAAIARFPIVGYDARSRTGEILADAFEQQGLAIRNIVSASDAEVIKVYVVSGLGVEIVPRVALGVCDGKLAKRDITDLLPRTQTVVSIRRNGFLTRPLSAFVKLPIPQPTRAQLQAELNRAPA